MSVRAFNKTAAIEAYERLQQTLDGADVHIKHLEDQAKELYRSGNFQAAANILQMEIPRTRGTMKAVRAKMAQLRNAVALRLAEADAEIGMLLHVERFEDALWLHFEHRPKIAAAAEAVGATAGEIKEAVRTMNTLRKARAKPESMEEVLAAVDPRTAKQPNPYRLNPAESA